MFEVGLANVCEEINSAFKAKNFGRIEGLLWPALDQFNDTPQLWFYAGCLFFQTGRVALAARSFERAIELDMNPLVLANLGASYRRLNQHEQGLATLKQALDLEPDYEPALVNYGAMYVNEGTPEKGIPALEKACELGRKKGSFEPGAQWNLGLLYLEAGRFAEGFDIYRGGYGIERLVRTYARDGRSEPKRLEPEDHARTVASVALRGKRPVLIVWGEQGLGDEMMFATIFNDAMAHYDIVFECHPRLEKLYRNSRWAWRMRDEGRELKIFPTRKAAAIDWPSDIVADFKCPIADLASFYRRDLASFTQAAERYSPFYHYNMEESASYRKHLELRANGKPIVGIAFQGGVMQTARQYRTLRIPEILYLMENTDCLFVSLDYDDMSRHALYLDEKFPGRFLVIPSIVQHWDYDHTAALLAACDLNVMVCQSVAHLSAGIGMPTRVLTPKRTAWREILIPEIGNRWYWWNGPHAELLMQEKPDSWIEPLNRVIADIKALA